MNKEFHFVKPKPTSIEILTNYSLLFQNKLDGISIEGFIDTNSNIELFGRGVLKGKNSNFTRQFPELVLEIKRMDLPPLTNFLAEAIVINPLTGKEDCGLASGRSGRTINIEYYANKYPSKLIIHDVVKVNGTYVGNESYINRLISLKKHILSSQPENTISVIDVYNDGLKQWKKVIKYGLEGLIIRDPSAKLGNGGIWKLKQEITEDIYCKGDYNASISKTYSNLTYVVNNEMRKGVFANLICFQLTKNGKEIHVCNLGGGFEQKDRIKIQQMLDMKEITKDKPLILEVIANDRYESGKLRNPNFVRIRIDKSWTECIINEKNNILNKQKSIEDY